jgi:hypothetical protein
MKIFISFNIDLQAFVKFIDGIIFFHEYVFRKLRTLRRLSRISGIGIVGTLSLSFSLSIFSFLINFSLKFLGVIYFTVKKKITLIGKCKTHLRRERKTSLHPNSNVQRRTLD